MNHIFDINILCHGVHLKVEIHEIQKIHEIHAKSTVTGQLADKPTGRQPTRTQYNSRTSNLADESTSGQSN